MRLDLSWASHDYAKVSKTEFAHDRSKTVGASEIAQCARKIAMKKQGVAQDEDHVDDPGFAVRGNIIEDHWAVPVLKHAIEKVGGKLLWATQGEQTTFEWKKKHASCTPDGMFTGVPRDWLAACGVKKCSPELVSEIKSIDPRIAPDKLPKAGHAEQAHFGVGMIRAATDYKPEYALLTYWNCSKLTDHWPLVIKFNEAYFERQLVKAKKIITTPWKKLPAEGKIAGGYQCGMCEFQRTCLGKRSTRSPDVRVPKSTLIELK